MSEIINAKAKKTSCMEDDVNQIWIVKGKTYQLEPLYRFIDEQYDEHFILADDFDEYFERTSHETSC